MPRRLRDGEDGAIAILTSVLFFVLLAASAVAVDVGRLAVSSRDQQGATDRAALDGVLDLAGSDDPFASVRDAVEASLGRNLGVSATGMTSARDLVAAELGTWDPDTGVFTALAPTPGVRPEAVRVVTRSDVGSLFVPGNSEVVREAIARLEAQGTIGVASTTARLDGPFTGRVMRRLLGSSVDLGAVGWQGLADTNVELGRLATELGVGTTEELLDATVTVRQLTAATARALPAEGATAAADLQTISAAADLASTVRLGELLAVDSGTGNALGADVGVLDLVRGAAELANRNNFVDVDLELPGVVTTQLRLIQAPQIAIGRAGQRPDGTWRTTARTNQTELALGIPLSGGIDLGGVVQAISGDLTIRVATGRGTMHLMNAVCGDPGRMDTRIISDAVTVSVDPVRILDVNLALIRARVGIEMVPTQLGSDQVDHPFHGPFASTPFTVSGSNPTLANAVKNGLRLTSDTSVRIPVPLLPDIVLPIGDVLNSVLARVGPVLDSLDGELTSALEGLGVSLGEAEGRALDLSCGGRVLVR